MIVGHEKPPLEALEHFGVKGMKWGVRKSKPLSTNTFKLSDGSRLKTHGLQEKLGKSFNPEDFKGKSPAMQEAMLIDLLNQKVSRDQRRARIRRGAIRAGLILGIVGARVFGQELLAQTIENSQPTEVWT